MTALHATNRKDRHSVCQIGAVRLRDGLEVESRTWLCSPPPGLEEFADINISIHGITPEDFAILSESHDGRGGARTLRVSNNGGLATLQ